MFDSNMKDNKSTVLTDLEERERICWKMAKVFLENKDAHGLHDMGVEIQALQRAKIEVDKYIQSMLTQ